MGLLDDFSSFVKTPEGMGLLSAVAGGLAGAQRGAPINSLGRAGLAGVMGYGNALDRQERTNENAVQNQFRQMQLAEMKRKQDAIAALGKNVPEQMRPFVDVAPEAVIKSMFKEPDKPQLVTVEGPDGKPMQRWIKPGEAQGVDIGAAPNKEAALPWYARKGQDGRISIDPAFAELEKTKASYGRPPPQPMAPVAYVDPTTGQTIWGTITEARGKPAANFNPTVQGAVAGAKERAETDVKTQAESNKAVKNSDKFLSVANQAKSILDSGKVTESGIGSAADAAGRMFGYSSESAQNAGELEAISGWMVSNVPRMEGPQSNFDVDNYKTMAGKIGDRTVPVPERKKALKAVMDLQEKYKSINQGGQPESGGSARKYNPKTGRIE